LVPQAWSVPFLTTAAVHRTKCIICPALSTKSRIFCSLVDDITNLNTKQDHEGTRRELHQWDWRQKIHEKKATKQKMQGEKKFSTCLAI